MTPSPIPGTLILIVLCLLAGAEIKSCCDGRSSSDVPATARHVTVSASHRRQVKDLQNKETATVVVLFTSKGVPMVCESFELNTPSANASITRYGEKYVVKFLRPIQGPVTSTFDEIPSGSVEVLVDGPIQIIEATQQETKVPSLNHP